MNINYCIPHFDAITTALKKKGLWHLVSRDSGVIAQRMRNWFNGMTPPHEFDPLVASMAEIQVKTQEMGLMQPDTCKCPLCRAQYSLGERAAHLWVDNCTDLMVVICHTNGITKH